MISLAVLPALEIYVNFTKRQMQLLMGERYPLHIHCHGIENLLYLFENMCLVTLEKGEMPNAYCLWCEKNPYHLINVLGPFSVTLQSRKFYEAEKLLVMVRQ